MNEKLTKLKAAVAYLRRLAFEVADAYFDNSDSSVTEKEFILLYRKYQKQFHQVARMLDNGDVQDYIEHVDYVDTYTDCDIQYITVEYNT